MITPRLPSLPVVLIAIAALGVAGCKDHAHQEAAKEQPGERTESPAREEEGTATIAGLRFLEIVTGGASAGEALPLIAFFHGHGGKPQSFRAKFATFPLKARIILPFGLHPGEDGGFEWFPGHAFKPEMQAKYAASVPVTEGTVSAALLAIVKARPTLGKPIASGFSQGAGLTFALALRHPDLLGAGCPMAGELPAQVFEGVSVPATKPELHAFIGDADPNDASSKRTVESFKALGYGVDLKILPGFGHKFEPAADEVFACLERAVRAGK